MRNLRTSETQSHSASNIPMVSGGLSPPIIARNATASYIQLKRNDTRVVPARVKNTFPWVQIDPPSSVAYGDKLLAVFFPPRGSLPYTVRTGQISFYVVVCFCDLPSSVAYGSKLLAVFFSPSKGKVLVRDSLIRSCFLKNIF